MRPAVPVLAYHSVNIAGNDYATNDHVAFAEDLRVLASQGWTVERLDRIVAALVEGRPLPRRTVAISMDDGTDFDFRDLDHPRCGPQRSMFGIVADFVRAQPQALPGLHVTSFVVVSPEVCSELDRTCLIGQGWWTDAWWADAVASGRWSIASHSWDHNHHAMSGGVAGSATRGTFRSVATFDAAEAEIAHAAARLRAVAPNPGDALFAYPYGEANDYLVREYFPRHHARIGVTAAFDTAGAPLTEGCDRWRLPRYVCGDHWKSPGDLVRLLREVAP